ncbi:major capsid protein [Subtercola sp. YIM 133946]|uniref:major capsid protein n=1 Tax=Subtercola sp. YIM 133946 TaxID=3118909 RepID=UPI002F958C0D
MALWTDIVEPAELTGYARAALADYEAARGTLARFLPNREVADVVVRFVAGSTGLIETANFRAFDAEPEVGRGPSGKRVTLELPALGQELPVTEYVQLRQRNASDDQIRAQLFDYTGRAARSIAETIERLRGIVLTTGKATINPTNFGGSFQADDDFGRSGGHTVAAASAWSGPTVDILGDLQSWFDTYLADNGEEPGAILASTRVVRAMAANNQFKTALVSGSSRPATVEQVNDTIVGNGLPPIIRYDRRVSVGGTSTKVIPDDRLLLLPAAVDTNDWEGTQLGATYWGQTLTASDPTYEIADVDQPGVVVGAYRNEKPPMIAQIISDAIGMPVLANADLSFVADVL